MKAATDMTEIHNLGFSQKKLSAIISIVEAGDDHGIDSEDFKRVFDVTKTSLQLEPVVDLPMPGHVAFTRHKMVGGENMYCCVCF